MTYLIGLFLVLSRGYLPHVVDDVIADVAAVVGQFRQQLVQERARFFRVALFDLVVEVDDLKANDGERNL